jgi:hypothetical protein
MRDDESVPVDAAIGRDAYAGRRTVFDAAVRLYLVALSLSGACLAIQFLALLWGYVNPGSVDGTSLWLNPGLACATGATLAALHHLWLHRRHRAAAARPDPALRQSWLVAGPPMHRHAVAGAAPGGSTNSI